MKILPMILLMILCMALAGCTGLGSVQRAVGMKPSWRVINQTEAYSYENSCGGLGIDSPYDYSCPTLVGRGDFCSDLEFIYHLDELDGCVATECTLVPGTGNDTKIMRDLGFCHPTTPIPVGGFVDTTYKNNTAEYPMECNRTSTCETLAD